MGHAAVLLQGVLSWLCDGYAELRNITRKLRFSNLSVSSLSTAVSYQNSIYLKKWIEYIYKAECSKYVSITNYLLWRIIIKQIIIICELHQITNVCMNQTEFSCKLCVQTRWHMNWERGLPMIFTK